MIESQDTASASVKPWIALCVLAILAGTLFVYQAALPGDFVYQDLAEVADNYRMGELSLLSDTAWQGVQQPARPLSYASFSVNQWLFGERPRGFLAVNIAIHLVCCFLSLRLLWLLTQASDASFNKGHWLLPLGAMVLLWAVHPLNVSAVAFVYQRMESLMACFFLAATIQVVHYLRQPKWWRIPLAVAFATLSAFSKELAVMLPLMPFILLPCSDGTWSQRVRRAVTVAIPLCLTWLAFAAYYVPQHERFQSSILATAVTPWQYLMTEASVVQHYLRSVVWPNQLSIAYDWPPVTDVAPVIATLCGLALAIPIGIFATMRNQLWGSGLLWYLLLLAPTSSVLPLSSSAEDYRNYLPLVGLLFVAASLTGTVVKLLGRWEKAMSLAVTLLLLAAAMPLANAGRQQARLYQSRQSVWQHAFDSGQAPYTSANMLSSLFFGASDFARAESFARKAVEADRSQPAAWSHLAMALANQGKEADALAALDEASEAAHDDGSVAFARANLLAKKDPTSAIQEYDKALSLDENNDRAWNNLGILLAREPTTSERARDCYMRSLALRPDNRSAYQNLGALYIKTGQFYDAQSVFVAALKSFKNDPDFRARLAAVEKLIREQELMRAKSK